MVLKHHLEINVKNFLSNAYAKDLLLWSTVKNAYITHTLKKQRHIKMSLLF